MSKARPNTCAEPGPYDYHCTEPPLHRYSCYDAGEDSSWNARSPEGWQTDTPHRCQDSACAVLDQPTTQEGVEPDPPYTCKCCRPTPGGTDAQA